MWVPKGSSSEITVLVTISKVEWIDENTATSFLLLLFFSGKRKVGDNNLFFASFSNYKKSKIGRKFRRQSHNPPHIVSKGQALRVLIKKCFYASIKILFSSYDYWPKTKNSTITFLSKTLTAFRLPPFVMAFFFFFFFLLEKFIGAKP